MKATPPTPAQIASAKKTLRALAKIAASAELAKAKERIKLLESSAKELRRAERDWAHRVTALESERAGVVGSLRRVAAACGRDDLRDCDVHKLASADLAGIVRLAMGSES